KSAQLFWDVMLRDRLEDKRQEALREFNCPVHLPHAAIRFDCFRRDDEYDGVRLRNQAAEAPLPVLASRDVVPVEEWRETTIFETSYQFVRKLGRIFARIGDEDFELLSCASVGHWLPGSRPESRTHGIGHMCRSSATADLIGEIRYSALDQTILAICS